MNLTPSRAPVIQVHQRVENETPRQRAARHQHERDQVELSARPWRIGLGLILGAWILGLCWFSFQRGIRPRVIGLDAQLTTLRWLTASAFLWVLLISPLTRLGTRMTSLFARRKEQRKQLRTGSNPPDSDATNLSLLETSTWLLPCLAALVGACVLLSIWELFAVLGIVSLMTAGTLLPWIPVIYLTRRAFPNRSEMVMVTMLLFMGTGIAQSVVNRGFYQHKYSNQGIRFVIPSEAATLEIIQPSSHKDPSQ